ncbi:hypothetical protein BGZ98_003422 [Dissophora globulifera]|nr:hypothetical protein BGZ98_003422 [Dissophora globulifera]
MTGPPKALPPTSSDSSSSASASSPTLQSGSWSGTRPVADNTPAAPLTLHPDMTSSASSATQMNSILTALAGNPESSDDAQESSPTTSASSTSAAITEAKDSTNFKIRVPRDLPNIPDAFRTRGPARSLPSSSPKARYSPFSPPIPRPHSAGSVPLYQTKLVGFHREQSNQAKRLHEEASMQKTESSKNYLMIGSNKRKEIPDEPTYDTPHAKHPRSRSKSQTSSPPASAGVPAQVAVVGAFDEETRCQRSPALELTTPSEISFQRPSLDVKPVAPLNANEAPRIKTGEAAVVTYGSSELKENATPPAVIADTTDTTQSTLIPLELVRVGTAILDILLSSDVSKDFVNKVPLSFTNYHSVIKRPMDLTTIEQKLWKSFQHTVENSAESLAPGLVAAVNSANVSQGYSDLQDFERDLRRIYHNAVFFNPAQETVHKDARALRTLFIDQLNSFREQPLYLFRADLSREMVLRMTDASVDLFMAFHQPLLDIMRESEELTTERPRFARLYATKNRGWMTACRDVTNAKIVLLSDLTVGTPYETDASKWSGSTAAESSTLMVNVKARAMIAKPVGERHEMQTVGDLDCPSAWIMVACVKSFDLDIDVPRAYERTTLSRLRHDLFLFNDPSIKRANLNPHQQKVFLEALGVKVSSLQEHPSVSSSTISASGSVTTRRKFRDTKAPSLSASIKPTVKSAATESEPISSSLPALLGLGRVADAQQSKPVSGLSIKTEDQDSSQAGWSMTSNIKAEPGDDSAVVGVPPVSTTSLPGSSLAMTDTSSMKRESSTNVETRMEIDPAANPSSSSMESTRPLTLREQMMLSEVRIAARKQRVPYVKWAAIEPTLTVDTAHGLFKRIYHVQGDSSLVVQNFKEMDTESFEQRVREVVCLLKLRGVEGIGQIQSIIDDEDNRLVGLSMTKYAYTLKAYATNARHHPSACQKLVLIQDMIAAISAVHNHGLAHRDLSEVNIMIDEDPVETLEDGSPRPWIRVIDFGKSVFMGLEDVMRWSMKDVVSDEELAMLPLVVLPPDHGYKLYRSILTLPRNKYDHVPLAPVDPQLEDVYSLGVLIWRTFSGKSPWNGAIEDDIKTIRYLVRSDEQIKFQIEREVIGKKSRELLLKCLTAEARTRSTAHQLKEWVFQPDVAAELLREFGALGGGRKRVRRNLD